MEKLRPNSHRAKNAMIVLWIILAIEIVSTISGLMQFNLLNQAAQGIEITQEAASANDIREQLIAILYLAAFTVSALTFIQWFRRAYFNLGLRTNTLTESDGWIAGSWFVPILCLYRPYQLMKEMFTETKNYLIIKDVKTDLSLSTNILIIWWTLWIANNIIGQFIFRIGLNAETIEQLTNLSIAGLISNFIGIPLALVTISMIDKYAKVEVLMQNIEHKELIQ